MIPEADSIVQGDCVEVMNGLPERCVDLIFADPPYNLQLKQELYRPNLSHVDAVDDAWDRFGSFEDYDCFTRAWLTACRRVLTDRGTLWVIGSYHNIYRVGAILQELGYWILNDVVWVKTNPMPQFRGVRLCNAHETLLWAKKSEKQTGYTFNYKALKAGNEDLQLRSDWYFPLCTGPERLKDGDGRLHSTQKPEALLHRIIRACSNPGDLVLDPFAGSGTTVAVAKRLGRRYLGIEREATYCEAARRRVAAVEPTPEGALDYPEAPLRRIPFAALLELGIVREGDRLRLGKGEAYAVVRADATVEGAGIRGSIHKVGASLLGASACNGWEHWWHLDRVTGEYRILDELRDRARELLAEQRSDGVSE